MKQRSFHIGPGAPSIMLIVLLLSLSVLGMLQLMNARGDMLLSARSTAVTESVYALNEKAEAHVRELDSLLYACSAAAADEEAYLNALNEILPAGMELDEDTVSWIENDSEGRILDCAVQIMPFGSEKRFSWLRHMLVTDYADDTEQGWTLWGAE